MREELSDLKKQAYLGRCENVGGRVCVCVCVCVCVWGVTRGIVVVEASEVGKRPEAR